MKLGTRVRFPVPDIEGEVVNASWSVKDSTLKVEVKCDDGEQRWFDARKLEVLEEPAEG
jgi:fructosamine-3-kinase